MINLLPTKRKDALRAARANIFLSRYIGIVLLAIVFLMGVLVVSYSILMQTDQNIQSRIDDSDVKAGVYDDTRQKVTALSDQLEDARVLLDQETSYASILTTLGQLMPAGTVLETLTLNNETLSGTPTEIIAYAKTDSDAALIQQNMQSSPLFSQVSLSGTDTAGGIADYPIKVTLSVTFNRSGM